MRLDEMRAEVYAAIKAPDTSTAEVTAKLNEAQLRTVERVSIPELKRFDVVSTVVGQAYTTLNGLAGGFSGKLLKVGTAATQITVFTRLERMVDAYGMLTEAGAVEAVCLEGSNLWYAKVPAVAEVLPVVYLQLPENLVDEEDEPTFIPKSLHRDCLVNRAAEFIWDTIEDGLEGEKVNTLNYRKLAEGGLTRLREYIARNSFHCISSMWRY